MTSRRPSVPTATLARRGVLLASPTLLLAGCGLLPLPDLRGGPAGGDGAADGAGAPSPSTAGAADGVATVDLAPTVLEDAEDAADLVRALEDSTTLRNPWSALTVTGTALLEELTAEVFTRLTGEEPPAADDADEELSGAPATTIRPPEGRAFLLATWESTDSEWQPAPRGSVSTAISLAVGGNVERGAARAREDETELSGAVLAVVEADPSPAAATLHTEVDDGVQQLSLIDGSLVETVAPALYPEAATVEVTDAQVLDVEVPDGVVRDVMHLRGTVDSAYLTSFIVGGQSHGGSLGWADEDEVFAVVQLSWVKDYTASLKDLSRIALVLEDGTEVPPEQGEDQIFGDHTDNLATFRIPADTAEATVRIDPRFQELLDDESDHVYDPIRATLTIA
ncbi:MAG: hypothetical protein ACTMH5_03605 [Brachybacterium sp.]|uniref:hypothetical protein n=1 Tax=Brachybacterium sp. TaxID=1891286 RepID=UPI003F905727